MISGADRLTRILDDGNPRRLCDGDHGIHVGALPVQVNWNHGAGSRSDCRPDRRGIDVARDWIDVDEPRRRAEPADASGGGEERIRRRDDFVARADPERHHRGQQRVGAGRHGDGFGDLEVLRKLALERNDLRAEDEALTVADPCDGGENLLPERQVLGLEIQQWHPRHRPRLHRITISGAPHNGRSLSGLKGDFGSLAYVLKIRSTCSPPYADKSTITGIHRRSAALLNGSTCCVKS